MRDAYAVAFSSISPIGVRSGPFTSIDALVTTKADAIYLANPNAPTGTFVSPMKVEELAKQFNVSTKTISRWRELGLVSRRLVFDGRKRVGFLRSSVDRLTTAPTSIRR